MLLSNRKDDLLEEEEEEEEVEVGNFGVGTSVGLVLDFSKCGDGGGKNDNL